MVAIKKRTVKDFIRALKTLDYYEESLFYLDFCWGIHPHFPGYISWIKFIFFSSISYIYIFLATWMIIDDYIGIETLKKSDILSPSIQIAFVLLTYKINKQLVKDLIEKVDKFWIVEEEMIEIQTQFRWIRYFMIFYKTAIIGTTIYYNIIALMSEEIIFPTECYRFCDVEKKLCYWFIFVFVDLSAFVLVWGIYTFDGIFAGSVAQLVAQLKLIKYRLKKLRFDRESSEEMIKRDLIEIIDHHNFILSFIDDINSLYSRVLFTQFSTLIFNMCIGSFLLTLDGAPTIDTLTQYVVYLSCMFSQVFIYTYGGQVIIDESASIADEVYQTDWFDASIPVQKTISNIILRAQQETVISVGGFSNLDLRMYLYAAKTAFSFYTMMNQIYENDLN